MKLKIFLGIVVLFLILDVFVYSIGTWVELPISVDDNCTANSFVMCSEMGKNYVPDTFRSADGGVIPYHNESTDKTQLFCAIFDDGDGAGFKVLNGSYEGIFNYTQLKTYSNISEENVNNVTYEGEVERHYDENCDADEIFPRLSDGRLDLTKYIENGVTYDILNQSNFANLDNFDIIAKTSGGNSVGGIMGGTVRDKYGPLENANVTIYFVSSTGVFIPYRTYLTSSDGSFTTFNDVELKTYFRTVITNRIPLTKYLIIVEKKGYNEFKEEVVLGIDGESPFKQDLDIFMSQVDDCKSDCTYRGDSLHLCRKECHGRKGCYFKRISETENGSVAADVLDKHPITDSSIEISVSGNWYKVRPCDGEWYPILPPTSRKASSSCPEGQESWKTTKIVKLNGKIVRMVLTLCR